ncbi:DUF4013 domain-containing protein [Halorussus litoreus]|uniref:DUF4013 domain-containing protein n=1 Tax=Halorussus litoreus TaxID=1710536 RepID=UPI0022B822F9|nr:DUF4013 domain-containing protein [Halorussus litoreus]
MDAPRGASLPVSRRARRAAPPGRRQPRGPRRITRSPRSSRSSRSRSCRPACRVRAGRSPGERYVYAACTFCAGVAVGYLAIPAVALGVTVGGSAPAGSATAGTSLLVLGASTVVFLGSLAFAYLLPAALVAVARSGRVRSAVELDHLRRSVADARYFVGWVAALSVVAVAALLFRALASLGRAGEVVGLALGFYAMVVAARLLGRSVAG